MNTKICTKCEKEKDLSKFHKMKSSPDRHAYWCKQCKSKQSSCYYKLNKDHISETVKKYYHNNIDRVKKYQKEWYLENGKKYYLNNKQRINYHSKKWRQKNPNYVKENSEKIKERAKKYYKNNKDKCKLSVQKWYKKNKDKHHAISAAYRSRKKQQTPKLSAKEETKVYLLYSILTYMNEISINIKWHVDHIIPLSKGGLHHPNNLQILEAEANLRKGAKILNV